MQALGGFKALLRCSAASSPFVFWKFFACKNSYFAHFDKSKESDFLILQPVGGAEPVENFVIRSRWLLGLRLAARH